MRSPIHYALLALAVLRGIAEFAKLQRWRLQERLHRFPGQAG